MLKKREPNFKVKSDKQYLNKDINLENVYKNQSKFIKGSSSSPGGNLNADLNRWCEPREKNMLKTQYLVLYNYSNDCMYAIVP